MNRQAHKKIGNIGFSIFSPKQVNDLSAAKIVTPELYDREGYPVDGGLMDLRLGVIDPGLRCKTCGQKLKECPGHFGYIELARPVVHINYARSILDLLKSTCKYCHRILIPDEKIKPYLNFLNKIGEEEGFEARRRKIKEIINRYKLKQKCPHCKAKQEKIKLEKPYNYFENDVRLSPIEVRARLEKISIEDLAIFGFAENFRPEWMILTALQIPPVTMRPSITLESGERSEDDLTHKLGDIVRINQRLFENINAGAPEVIIEDLWDLLQYHITTFFDNEVSQLPPARHRGGQVLKTLSSRIKSKEGRIRYNLAGKRTDFSARTVISPDPLIKLNEVGIPKQIAMNLTIPEKVTEWNKAYLLKFIENGPKKYPGANYVLKPDGKRKTITSETKDEIIEELENGYIVERHLIDGDIALFNRQPSLHRMSMMCHKVKVLPGKTFRLNPAVCNPYNADFDGDEMNLHVPQTEEARAEAEILMLVETQLISPRYGLSVVGCIHDGITGNYLLTKELILQKSEAIDLLYNCGVRDFTDLPKKDKLDGKEVFSMLLPQDFSFTGKDKSSNEVKIVKGILKVGVMDKANLGQESGLMLRNIYERYGPAYTAELLGKISKLGIAVLARRGFSIGIGDMDLPLETQEDIKQIIESAEKDAFSLIDKYFDGKLEALPGRNLKETLELRILEVLNRARNKSGDLAMKQVRNSSATTMARCGSRGNALNIAQMTAIVGQQALRGKRIDHGFLGRTLSYFKKGDLSPKARGFIKQNFKTGLKPHEFFFGAMTGRDALMDTALRTPKSGYLYRRLSNALQDLKVDYDGSVRDASKKIVQFAYGEDNLDVSKTKNGEIEVKCTATKINESAKVKEVATKYAEILPPALLERVKKTISSNATKQQIEKAFEQIVSSYNYAKINPGECVGLVGAESIGEPGTQMTLNTFHFAGVAEMNVTTGLPRIIEIFDARKIIKTPIMEIFLKHPHNTLEHVKKFAAKIKETKLDEFVREYALNIFNQVLKMKVHMEVLEDHDLKIEELAKIIKPKAKGFTTEVVGDEIVFAPKGKFDDIKQLYNLKEKIRKVKIKGIKKILQVLPVKRGEEYIVLTSGTNLADILALKEVDTTRTTTNDVHEIRGILGVEAARQAIINEVYKVIEEQGLNIDIRHIMLVADTMCATGEIKGVTRYGVVSEKASVLARVSFETPIKHLVNAALEGEIDYLSSVVENVMINQPVPLGTGLPGLVTKMK